AFVLKRLSPSSATVAASCRSRSAMTAFLIMVTADEEAAERARLRSCVLKSLLMKFLLPHIFRIFAAVHISVIKDRCGGSFDFIDGARELLVRPAVVLPSALMVGVATSSRPPHLQELTRHVSARKIIRSQ